MTTPENSPARSVLAVVCDGALESVWLASLVAVPVFFNIYTERVFEADKALLLRALGVLAAAILVVRSIDRGLAWRGIAEGLRQYPIVGVLLGWTAIYALSSALGIAPATSWWGGYERNHGTATWAALVAIFFSGLLTCTSPGRIERTIDALIASSLAVAGYALAQGFGLDPIAWSAPLSLGRPTSTAGNPIFVAAYLAMVLPLALTRALSEIERNRFARAALYAGSVALQGVAMAITESRGPGLALAAGLCAMLALLVRLRLWRSLRAAVAIVAVTGCLAVLVDRQSVGHDRVEQQRSAHPSTTTTRTIIWDAVADLIETNPSRLALGHGPETLFVAFSPVYPAVLGQYERRDVSPDRAHNQTLDALAMTGVAGCAAEIVFFFLLFQGILRRLSLLEGSSGRRFVRLSGLGAVLGGLGPIAFDGSLRFAGLGIPVGATAGMAVALVLGWRDDSAPVRDPGRTLVLVGLFTAILSHFAEIQVGIAVVMTNLALMACAAMAVAAWRGSDGAGPSDVTPPNAAILHGAYAGLLLLLFTFGLYTPTTDLGTLSIGQAWIVLPFWMFAAGRAWSAAASSSLRSLALYCAASIGIWASFVSIYKPWIDWAPPSGADAVLGMADQLSGATGILYASVVVWIAFHSLSLTARLPATTSRRARIVAWPAVVVAVVAVAFSFRTILTTTTADISGKLAGILRRAKSFAPAVRAIEQAHQLRPHEERYSLALSQTLMEKVRHRPASEGTPGVADLDRAESVLLRAAEANPLDPDCQANLARLYRFRATRVDGEQRARLFAQAEAAYRKALALRPQGVVLWNELAVLYGQLGRQQESNATFQHSFALDPENANTYWTRGELEYDQGDLTAALHDYTRATEIRPSAIEAWSGMSATLALLGRFDESIAAAKRALEIDPDDAATHRNLARLYRATGDTGAAHDHAQRALQAKQPYDRRRAAELIQQLELAPAEDP